MKLSSPSDGIGALIEFNRGKRASAFVVAGVILALLLGSGTSFANTSRGATTSRGDNAIKQHAQTEPIFPVGVPDSTQPSGLAPPGSQALPNYTLTYVNNFNGRAIPAGWFLFSGVPGGDPGGRFAPSHVVVRGGLLLLQTWKDPNYANRWITGGLCQCGHVVTYGAFFVRSKVSWAGPNQVELLWPANNTWPPEIDFNETGGLINSTTASLHWSHKNHVARFVLKIDMTKWHTWGVVWTSSEVLFVVDGKIWSSVHDPAQVPHVKMRLDFEQRAMCDLHRQCPTAPVTMSVDWVAEYSPS